MIESIIEYLRVIVTNPTIMLFGAITLIEVTPIRVNPWGWLFSCIGNALNKGVYRDLETLKTQQMELKQDLETLKSKQTDLSEELEKDRAQDKRRHILEFANSCRRHEDHDHEEWNNVITDIKDYEMLIYEKKLSNGVIEENIKYLRELYHDRNVNNDFL